MNNNILRRSIFAFRDMLIKRHSGLEVQRLMANCIREGHPLMVARFGAVEIKAVAYGILPPPMCYFLKDYTYRCMPRNAGFFPATDEAFKQFAMLMKDSMADVDILASWRPEELLFRRRLAHCYNMVLEEILPTDRPESWTSALEGKKVLVVNPFADTIRCQYDTNRERIWHCAVTLPEFASLETVKAVQTIAGNHAGFDSWFDALDYMKHEIETKDFDVALLGCGAYGFPLASYIKRMGKQAIHMGGNLQLLFGIKGKRWDNAGLYNEYWVRPSEAEQPQGLTQVEGGCYW